MKLFSIDGPFYQFFSRLWDMIKLNFCWLICCLPIVTIGASTVAAYSVTLKMVDEQEGYVARQFFKAFKANLKNGIPLGILTMIAVYAIYLDFEIFFATENPPVYVLIAAIVAIFVCALCLIYAYPLSARYENTMINTLKNSFHISIRYFGRTIALVFILAVETVFFFFTEWLMILFALIGPACYFLTVSGFAMYLFRQLEQDPDTTVSNNETE